MDDSLRRLLATAAVAIASLAVTLADDPAPTPGDSPSAQTIIGSR